ncbi:hypothetical protein [Streptomyces sp. PAM3C]|uniref:hypothetical protein n=1 Tax=Streptomyces sp. PAM3C TaxID=2847300 RepID=UPI001C1E54C2|nr:hypothetical protein [Streptomyces sp. PAM3C]MBU5944901.1 hypothetical protein [Streptomyces sp. PAM3C]
MNRDSRTPAAPTLAEQIAVRILDAVPTLAEKISLADLTAVVAEVLASVDVEEAGR